MDFILFILFYFIYRGLFPNSNELTRAVDGTTILQFFILFIFIIIIMTYVDFTYLQYKMVDYGSSEYHFERNFVQIR